MSIEQYYSQTLIDDEFDRIENKKDYYSIEDLQKHDYEQLMAKITFVDNQNNLGGFEATKMIENGLESFYQTAIIAIIFLQLPFEGILNSQKFGIDKDENKILGISKIKVVFLASTTVGYIFMGTGIMSYVAKLQKDAMGIKDKILITFNHDYSLSNYYIW